MSEQATKIEPRELVNEYMMTRMLNAGLVLILVQDSRKWRWTKRAIETIPTEVRANMAHVVYGGTVEHTDGDLLLRYL